MSLQGHTLIQIPEGLVGATDQRPGGQGDSPDGPELGAFLSAPGKDVVVEQGFAEESVPETASQEEPVRKRTWTLQPARGWGSFPPSESLGSFLPSAHAYLLLATRSAVQDLSGSKNLFQE